MATEPNQGKKPFQAGALPLDSRGFRDIARFEATSVEMDVVALEIPAVKVIKPKKFGDERGFFSETYNKKSLAQSGIALDFVQDNHSHSVARGVVRGLHFQVPPYAQAKLVRVVRGAIFDVAVDIRRGSPTYGRHVAAVVSAREWNQIFVAVGFAHGFCTLEPDTEVIYKVTDYYAPEHERGLMWSDPDLAIAWPVTESEAVLSERDRAWPRLSQLTDTFSYDERA